LTSGTRVSIVDVADQFRRLQKVTRHFLDDESGELIQSEDEVPIWLDPVAAGASPMCAALRAAHVMVSEWISAHPENFPPVVMHVTNGRSTDGDPIPVAEELKKLCTADGNALLFNCYVSSTTDVSMSFASNEEDVKDETLVTLFKMSSCIPKHIRTYLVYGGCEDVQAGSRGLARSLALGKLLFDETVRYIAGIADGPGMRD
jgi:hypothetical protein